MPSIHNRAILIYQIFVIFLTLVAHVYNDLIQIYISDRIYQRTYTSYDLLAMYAT